MGWVVTATPRPVYSRERGGTYYIGGWVCPRENLAPAGIRSTESPARSKPLYRLRCPGPMVMQCQRKTRGNIQGQCKSRVYNTTQSLSTSNGLQSASKDLSVDRDPNSPTQRSKYPQRIKLKTHSSKTVS